MLTLIAYQAVVHDNNSDIDDELDNAYQLMKIRRNPLQYKKMRLKAADIISSSFFRSQDQRLPKLT